MIADQYIPDSTSLAGSICGGIGAGAYQSVQTRGIRPIATDLESIDGVIRAYLEGGLIDRVERLH
jgi:predicted Fe-Mo cluster-binding NifX family protein